MAPRLCQILTETGFYHFWRQQWRDGGSAAKLAAVCTGAWTCHRELQKEPSNHYISAHCVPQPSFNTKFCVALPRRMYRSQGRQVPELVRSSTSRGKAV